jgi:glutathione S-transferase
MAKLTLYHAVPSRSSIVHWMMEELGEPYDLHVISLKKGENRQPAYLAINPMGKVPALAHGDVVVTEAAAICAYLADVFPSAGLAPATSDPRRGVYYRWMFFAPSCIEPMMLDRLGKVTRENTTAAGHGDFERVMASIEQALSNGPFILGDKFSAADVVMGSTLFFATMFGAIPKEGRVKDYVDRIAARPAHQTMVRKNGEQTKAMGL